jgi:RNA polymerase sigma-70 factor (ECF subfamily)
MNFEAASYFPGALPSNRETAQLEVKTSQVAADEVRRHLIDGQPVISQSSEEEGLARSAILSDETLLEELRDGNKEALAVLFRRYARVVRTVSYRILRNEAEADDLLQEVFLFIFRKWALFDSTRGAASSWIIQITYHRAIDRRRYLASRHFYSGVALEDALTESAEPKAEIEFYDRSMEGVLGKAVLKEIEESLSENQRRTIQLYFFEGYTLEEIAGLIGQPLGNIRNHYYRGLEKMRQHIYSAKLLAK